MKSDADRTGFSKEELIETLKDRDGDLYRIEFHLSGEDSRIQLRENLITEVEIDLILKKLKRMDNASSYGAWTKKALSLINKNPTVSAKKLAAMFNVEKDWLKIHIRKLKNLGFTISHKVGYSISVRGESLIKLL